MIRFRISFVALLAVAAFIAAPAVAMAAGPITTPRQILHETFDGALDPRVTLTANPSVGATPPAFWGPVAGSFYGASGKGLWCAGSVTGSPTVDGWSLWGGKYPAGTFGHATVVLPELASYYSSSLELQYKMPSVNVDWNQPFTVSWWANTSTSTADAWKPLAATAWTRLGYPLSVASNKANLSRRAGSFWLAFYDYTLPNPVATPYEGPTVDELYVRGWVFGKVRALESTVSAGHAVVRWVPPCRSTTSTVAEERPIVYRVYRRPDRLPEVWTEVTPSAGTTATAFTDAATLNDYFVYAVQVYSRTSTAAYGEPATSTRVTLGSPPPATKASLTPAVPDGANGWHRTFPKIAVSRDLPGTTFVRWDAGVVSSSTATPMTPQTPAEGTRTLTYYGSSTANTVETPSHTLVVKYDKTAPAGTFVFNGSASTTFTYASTATVDSSMADSASGVLAMAVSRNGGASWDATRAYAPRIVISLPAAGTYAVRVRYADRAGNTRVLPRTIVRRPTVATSVTIRTSATSVRSGYAVVLSGAGTPSTLVGKVMVVYVLKPGRSTYSYSSARGFYSLGGKAAWAYRYLFKVGMTKGYYRFKAAVPAQPGFLASTSPTIVTVRLY